jgi:hypothetical protein
MIQMGQEFFHGERAAVNTRPIALRAFQSSDQDLVSVMSGLIME